MTKFLCIQHTYNGIDVALFNDDKIIDKIFEDKKRASKYFVTCINSLLYRNNLSLDDLHFIAVNKGPGPFTTLRVVLASVNGLAFAIKKPIIGVDGLDAILSEHAREGLVTVALLDACGKDVYFGISNKNLSYDFPNIDNGYKNIEVLLKDIENLFIGKSFYFIGNGALKYRDKILALFGDNAIFDDFVPEVCSIDMVGKIAFDMWNKKEGLEKQILPVYLKSISY